ncbi:class I SAM-dependent methyltransferase [Thermovibrio ammonificans]
MGSNPFNGGAFEYDAFYSTPFGRKLLRLEGRLLEELLKPYRAGPLLEVGCGTGAWMEFLKGKGFTPVVGVDISLPMVKVARSKGLEVVVGNATDLPFKNRSFKASYFVTSLEFIENPLKALSEAIRVTEKALLIGFLNRHSLLNLKRRLKALLGLKTVYRHARFFTLKEVKELVAKAAALCGTRVTFEKSLSTLNFTFGNFAVEPLERLSERLPTGAFKAALFRLR